MRRRMVLGGLGASAVAACAPKATPLPDIVAETAYPKLGEIVEVEGAPVHLLARGKGPQVVLIHGASANLRDWAFTHLEQFAPRYRAIAVDRPGFGYSARGSGDWSPRRQAARLRAAMERIGVTRPIVVGHSWGAAVALGWALDAPVAGVVCVSGATMPWGLGADVAQALGIGRWGVDQYTARLSARRDSGAIEDFVARAFKPQRPPEGYLEFIGAPLSLRAGALSANADDLAGLHGYLSAQSALYPQITAPVEILHGGADWLLSIPRHVEGLANRLHRAKVSIAPGVGHMAHHARPDMLLAALDRIAAQT